MSVDLITARMADSTRPLEIPDRFKLRPNGVALYLDGSYAAPLEIQRQFPRIWRICVTGNAELAPHARVIDVERFDATPADVNAYNDRRAALHERTVVYCSRDTVAGVASAVREYRELDWWLATLDGQPWTPTSIVAWIRANVGVELDPARIRAIQIYPMGTWDGSACFGGATFSPPPR